jgi:hypothetical protein
MILRDDNIYHENVHVMYDFAGRSKITKFRNN